MVIEKAIDHGFAVRVGEDGFAEDIGGVERGSRRQADLDRVEVFEDPAVFGDIVGLIPEAEIAVRHLAIEKIAPMAFIDDHEVVLVNRRRVFRTFGIEHAPNQALDRADMDSCVIIGSDVRQALKAENIGKSLAVDNFGGGELVLGLPSERAAIYHEADAPEAFGGD